MTEDRDEIETDEDEMFLDKDEQEEEGPTGDLEDQLEAALDAAYIEGEMKALDEAEERTAAGEERPANVPADAVRGEDGVWRLPKKDAPDAECPLDERGAQELLAEIWKLNDDIKEVRCAMGMRKAQYKALKGELDSLRERQDELTDRKKAMERAAGEVLPLFPSPGVVSVPKASLVDGETLQKGDAAFLDPDAWRKAPLSDLVLPPAILSRLEDNDVHTVGQLEDLRASGKGLAGIKGFGPAKITTIEDAVVHWLSKNRDKDVLAAAAAGPEAPAVEGGGA